MSNETMEISDEQLAEYKKHFKTFDYRHEGTVLRDDIGSLLRACGQVPTEGWIKERIKVVDPENKGFVEWDSFIKIIKQASVQGNPDDELLEAFRRFDKGLTGVIQSSDLRHIMTSLGDVLTEEEVDELIRDADPMSEGKINYESLVRTLIYGPN